MSENEASELTWDEVIAEGIIGRDLLLTPSTGTALRTKIMDAKIDHGVIMITTSGRALFIGDELVKSEKVDPSRTDTLPVLRGGSVTRGKNGVLVFTVFLAGVYQILPESLWNEPAP